MKLNCPLLKPLFFGVLVFVLLPSISLGLSPIVLYQDLVAGEGEAGFEDGPFYSAQFNHPIGLALNADGSVLYVADQQNNRIRAILLDQGNSVKTLAGTGEAGKKDGPLLKAAFNMPKGLALLSGDQLAVNDAGNNLIRLIDLKSGSVITLAGNGQAGTADGQALQSQVSAVWAMAYFPPNRSLYFSQPDSGILRRLDLDQGRVETVLQNNSLLPHPAALCVADGKIYVADHDLPTVYELQSVEKMAVQPVSVKAGSATILPTPTPTSVSLQPVGQANHVIALAGGPKFLYAYQTGVPAPIFRLFPNPEPVTFVSALAEGDNLIDNPATLLPHFRNAGIAGSVGFVADSRSQKRFFISNPSCQLIASFRDLRLYGLGRSYRENSGGVIDFDYPLPKPDHTFRILMFGRSYLSYVIKTKTFPLDGGGIVPVAKRLEVTLNTQAALNDVSRHYEVFNMSTIQDHQLYVWPYYQAPRIAQTYDADMAIIMMDPGASLDSYYFWPLTPEGVPAESKDPEFMLKPNSEKYKSGPLHELIELCIQKKLLGVDAKGTWTSVPSFNQISADPQVREKLIQVVGRPLELLNQKLKAAKTEDGTPRKLVLCFFPNADIFSSFESPTKYQRLFWKELCTEKGIPFLDLCDDFTALRLTFYPFSEESGMDHFDGNGHTLFNEILAHELIRQKLIPFEPTKP